MDQKEIAADRAIDPAELDVEAVQQADLYGKWAERYVRAKGEQDRLEWVVELTEARLQGDIRTNPAKYDVEDPKETAIKSAARTHPTYVKAVEAYQAARLEAAFLQKAEKAIEEKGSMIRELVKLHGQQYFAGPKVPNNLISIWQAHRAGNQEVATDRIRERVRKRVRVEGQT